MQRPRDYLIHQRRKAEDQRDFYNSVRQDDQKQRFLAHWEQSTDQKIQARNIQNIFNALREKSKQELNARRDKLASKFAEENNKYMEELSNRQESIDQRRDRLENRARELKEARESRNKAFSEQQMYKKFLAESDELREAKSRANELHYAKARQDQILEKQSKQLYELEEKKIYDELWEEQRLEKEKRALREKLIQEEKNAQLREHLTEQVIEIEKKRQELQQMKDEETRLMKEQWDLEEQEELRLKARKLQESQLLQNEVNQFNARKQRIAAEELERERLMDLKLLEMVLKRENEEDEREKEYRNELKRQAIEYQNLLKLQMQKEKEDESEIDRLRNLDAEKQRSKQQAQWDAEQRARDNLMREIIEERKRQIAYKLKKSQEEKALAEAERAELEEAIDKQLRLEEAQQQRKRDSYIENQQYLQKQMHAKQETENAILFMERAEEKAQLEANRAYEMALQRELKALRDNAPQGYEHLHSRISRR